MTSQTPFRYEDMHTILVEIWVTDLGTFKIKKICIGCIYPGQSTGVLAGGRGYNVVECFGGGLVPTHLNYEVLKLELSVSMR